MSARHLIVFVLSGALFVGCGKKAETADVAPPAPNPPIEDVAGDTNEANTALDEVEDEAARRQRILGQLATAEIAGFDRMRGELQGGFVTLQHATKTANTKGNTVIVEATVSFCDGCQADKKEDVEARKEQILAQYGELHAKNPTLAFDIAELLLLPERTGVATYVKSYVSEGETRAAMHGLEVSFSDGLGVVRFFAYPQSPFPQSAEEHDAAMTRVELEDAVQKLFAGLWPILQPPR